MDKKYIPYNEAEAQKLQEKLAKNMAFRSVDDFIAMVNMGYLDNRNKEILTVAKEIKDTYKNIAFNGKNFTVRNTKEITVETFAAILKFWKPITALKRVAEDMLTAGYEADTKLIFATSSPGIILLEKDTEEYDEETEDFADAALPVEKRIANLLKYDSGEKIFKSASDLASNPFLKTLIKDYLDENSCYISLDNIIFIDDSFVDDISKIIKTHFSQI